jgi:outer membrane protein OmpA-like peptidoglycan-associated protein
LCVEGSPSQVRTNDNNFTWSCSGSNGGAVSSCSAAKAKAPPAPGPKLDGLCGYSNGVMALSQPVEGLCARGTATAVVGHGPWNWNCVGENGGMSVSCTAPLEPPAPIDGACGSANGVPTLVKPTGGLCAAGVTGRVSGAGPWTWTCSGANGGAPSSCIAPMAGKGAGAMPSLTTPAVGESAAASAPSPSELSTPRLPSASDSTLPALDKKTLPSLTSPKLSARAKPSSVPAATTLDGQAVPAAAPGVSDTSRPLTPPSAAISPAPALQEETALRNSRIPGNHLELDPTISTILFTRGSGNIEEKVLPTLNKLVAVLSASPDARVTLISYADAEEITPRGARRLSLTRALVVRDYLTSQGLSESRIDVRAEGANTTTGYIDRVDVKVNE